jgi:hypothetical protein
MTYNVRNPGPGLGQAQKDISNEKNVILFL